MSRDCYADYFPLPHTILGVRLRPLSLGALIHLYHLRNAFVAFGRIPDEGDLLSGLFVCSRTFQEASDAYYDAGMQQAIAVWKRKIGKFNLAQKIQHFREYLEEGLKGPIYRTGDGREINIPGHQVVKVYLMANTTLSETEILDRPWLRSVWDYVTHLSLTSKLQVEDGDAIEEAQEIANRLAKQVEEEKCRAARN